MLELWLIRHGETDWNTQGRIQGSSDTPLNSHGVRQAERLGARLQALSFDAVYASDLQRARSTATTALPGVTPQLDPRLRELAYGVLEGKAWSELDADEAAIAAHWHEDPYARRVPGGESYGDLVARVEAFRLDLPSAGRVLAFTHGGTVRSALYALTGRPNGAHWRFAIDNTSITRVRYDERGVTVLGVNDRAHLDAAD